MISVDKIPNNFLKAVIQKYAVVHKVEGTVQFADNTTIKVIVCGKKELVDAFLDVLHKEAAKVATEALHIEPFIKDRDYRGVFRVIE